MKVESIGMNARAKRTGNRVQDIAPDRLALLNGGSVEAATLTECLAVDFAALLRAALPDLGEDAALKLEAEATTGISRRMALAARLILDRLGPTAMDRLRGHPSDTVRGWVCFMVSAIGSATVSDRLAMIRPLADDRHFGVREWAWLAVRPHLAADLENAVALLAVWARSFRTSAALRQRGDPATGRMVRTYRDIETASGDGIADSGAPQGRSCLLRAGFRWQLAERCRQGSPRMGPRAL
jgi:hypothetical protein